MIKMCLQFKKQAPKYKRNIFVYDHFSSVLRACASGETLNYCLGFKDYLKPGLDLGYNLWLVFFSLLEVKVLTSKLQLFSLVVLPCTSNL